MTIGSLVWLVITSIGWIINHWWLMCYNAGMVTILVAYILYTKNNTLWVWKKK